MITLIAIIIVFIDCNVTIIKPLSNELQWQTARFLLMFSKIAYKVNNSNLLHLGVVLPNRGQHQTRVTLCNILKQIKSSDCSIRSGDLDNEKTWEKEDRRFRVVVLEKSTESIVDGEKDKHMDNREHQTGMETGVKGAKGSIKLLWARGESRRDGRWRDARENEWSEKERKIKTKMDGHTHGVLERSHHQQHETPRDRAGWRGAATDAARSQMRLDGTR